MPATFMLVPKATVDLDSLAPGGQNDVWRSRKAAPMQPEAVSHHVQEPANDNLGLSVFTFVPPHDRTPLFRYIGPGLLCRFHY